MTDDAGAEVQVVDATVETVIGAAVENVLLGPDGAFPGPSRVLTTHRAAIRQAIQAMPSPSVIEARFMAPHGRVAGRTLVQTEQE
jgi:hypothetical protein